jgi:hypothetical protein
MLSMPLQEPNPDLAALEEQFVEWLAQPHALLNTGPADPSCNCHGWVFTGGRYSIDGHEAQHILEANHYREVREPQVDDLAIYRDERGQILHTALVRTVTSDGLILLESKWGQMGRYIHRPSDLRFGRPFTYYRSSRRGHLLRGLDGVGPTAALPLALPSCTI